MTHPPYTELTFTETASSISTALEFEGLSPDATWLLDDISVTPTGVPDGGSDSFSARLRFARFGCLAAQIELL